MHKVYFALALVLTACATPAYRAAEVPVPAAYSVSRSQSQTVKAAVYDLGPNASPQAVQVSRAAAPSRSSGREWDLRFASTG